MTKKSIAKTSTVSPSAIGIVVGLSALPMILAAAISYFSDIPVRTFMRDPLSIVDEPFYLGFLSQLGIFVWASIGAISLFVASWLRSKVDGRRFLQFFLTTGIMALFLGIDDVFMFHELVFPTHLGISEEAIYLFYCGFLAWYARRFQGIIRRTDYTFLLIALISFALSVSIDKVHGLIAYYYDATEYWTKSQDLQASIHVVSQQRQIHSSFLDPYLVEDGFKFVGLVAWLAYVWQTALSVLKGFQGDDSLEPAAARKHPQ